MTSNGRKGRLTLVLVVLLVACGKGGTTDSTPSISNFEIWPTEALLNQGGGAIEVTGTFDFTDPGKDLAVFHIASPVGDGLDVPITGAAGFSSGTIQGTFLVSTATLGHFTFQIYVIDEAGNRSNTLSGAFDVWPDDTGSTWTERSFPVPPGTPDFQLRRVRWLRSRHYAVGSGTLTSSDGVTWTELSTGPVDDVTWTGSRLVAVHYPSSLTSPDGVAWTAHPLPAVAGGSLAGVTASGTTLVAVGAQIPPGAPDPRTLILTSSDGIDWSEVPVTYAGELKAVAWSGSRFVAVGVALGGPLAEGLIVTSPDGVAWTEQRLAQVNFLQDLAWSGSRFVAVGYPGALTSTDGVTWEGTGAGSVGPNNAIAWSGHRFMTCGIVSCASSVDGLLWTNTSPGPGTTINGLAWGETSWVAVGTDGLTARIYTSP